jgi:hypothetical protein
MKVKLLAVVILATSVGTAGAVLDVSVGPYFGMDIPIANDAAKSGSLFGLQGKVSLLPYLAVGAYYSSSSLGDVDKTFFEGDPDQFTDTLPGGDVKSFGLDAYFGMFGGVPGFKLYVMGSVGNWKWQRDFTDDVSEVVWRIGPGAELVLPMGLGIEGRGMFQIAPTDGGGSVKSFLWFVGANYHFFSLFQ